MQDASQIREHMPVVGSDGRNVGTVDKVEGDRIKLTKKDEPEGSGRLSGADLERAACGSSAPPNEGAGPRAVRSLLENLPVSRRVGTLFAMLLVFLLLSGWLLSAGAGAEPYLAMHPNGKE